jgi:hypothetical protein
LELDISVYKPREINDRVDSISSQKNIVDDSESEAGDDWELVHERL